MKNEIFADLLTPEGEKLLASGEIPWNIHPRPALERDSFLCLNGKWQFSASADGAFDEEILVPFPPESLLSGIHRRLGKNPVIRYRRSVVLPDGFRPAYPHRVLLHFGAVDQIAEISWNSVKLGTHRGGYEAFAFDITDVLQAENELTVTVRDELHTKILPYGKQCEKRGGMWYTPVTGIWQTVWLECVPETYVRSLKIVMGEDFAEIRADGVREGEITVITPEGERTVPLTGGTGRIFFENPRLWSPDDPYLYRFTLRAGDDCVRSYFAQRTLDIRTIDGIPRLCLNGEPVFFHGLLDQGYYSDGIFTPASPESYTGDILATKSLGFNTLRKHIKIEPQRFYYECDRLGMFVFQDMVNNGGYSFLRDTALPTIGMKKLPNLLLRRTKAVRDAFSAGMESTVRQLDPHPSIVYWTIFNEGWGQFDSAAMYEKLRTLDSTRFIDTASGWFSSKHMPTDVESLHIYFKPVKIRKSSRPVMLSEFGGYVYKPNGHAFNLTKTYGYRNFDTQADFENAFAALYENEIVPAIADGLCGSICTQLTDVEDETNGLLSYDRRVCKVRPKRLRKIAKKLVIAPKQE